MALHPIKYVWASNTTNKTYPSDETSIKNGILYEGEVVSNQLNGIEETNQYAIRELQTIGGYYDNNQIYNQNHIVFVLVNENGLIKQRFYICKKDNVTGKPPLTGTSAGKYNDVDVINIKESTEDTTNWNSILVDNSKKITYRTSGKANYSFFSIGEDEEPKGTIRVSTYDSDDKLQVAFDVSLLGRYSDDNILYNIRISNVFYSDDVRKSSNKFNGIYIGHPGFTFFIGLNSTSYQTELGLCVNDDTYVKKIEIDYGKSSLLNSAITKSTFDDSSVYIKLLAIREGGGSYINNLGDIYHNVRNDANASNGDTYDFYLFARGCVPFTTGIVLNTKYYHQWSNGGMASVNIDVSDSYLVNKGVVMGQINGAKLDESLPNITARTGNTYELGSNMQPAYAMNMSGEAYSQYGNSMGPGWEGAFFADSEKPNDVGFKNGLSFFATSQTQADGNFYQLYLKFDASKSNSVYQDGAPVRGKCFVTTFLLQAF